MEIRNLQQTGGASLTLTLPKDWINKQNLKNKDRVVISSQKSGNLIIIPYLIKKRKSVALMTIGFDDTDSIKYEIIGYYISGVDEIEIKTSKINFEQRRIVRETIRLFIGFEIVEETSERIVLKNIFDDKKFLVNENIEKIFLIIGSMLADCIESLDQKDKDLAKDIVERDLEVNKLHYTILRQAHSLFQFKTQEEELDLTLLDLHYFETVAIQLERIADHISKIANALIVQNTKDKEIISSSLLNKAKKISALLDLAEKAVIYQDKNRAFQILKLQKSDHINKPISKAMIKKSSIHIIIEDSVNRMRGYIENIAEETIYYINAKK